MEINDVLEEEREEVLTIAHDVEEDVRDCLEGDFEEAFQKESEH